MDPQSYLSFLGVISPNVRESKTVLDSGFHAMESGIYGAESRIQNCWIPEFTAKISTVPETGFHCVEPVIWAQFGQTSLFSKNYLNWLWISFYPLVMLSLDWTDFVPIQTGEFLYFVHQRDLKFGKTIFWKLQCTSMGCWVWALSSLYIWFVM